MHLSIASTNVIPEFINVLNVSDIEANSDFKLNSKEVFKLTSINFLPVLVA